MILFFDLETNGLAKSMNAPPSKIENWPNIVQIAWSIFDYDGVEIKKVSSIIFPKDFTITKSSSSVHGITTEMAKKEGRSIDSILSLFNEDIVEISLIVSHNLDFDLLTLNAEFLRNQMKTDLLNINRYCTMKSPQVVNYCKIPNTYRSGYKWPSLSELHMKLFDKSFDGVHNATADVDACARCFFELKKRGVIIDKNV